MDTNKAIEKIKASLLRRLKPDSTAFSEFELLKHLESEGVFADLDTKDASLTLFRKHFIVMHTLYLLQEDYSNSGLTLHISALEISLTHSTSSAFSHSISRNDNIRSYYCNLENYSNTNAENVNEMLSDFFNRFSAWGRADEACDILGVDNTADWSTVQSAYRKKANQTHPDKGGSHEEFTKINIAYEQLKTKYQK